MTLQLKELSLTYDGTFDDVIMTSVSALSDLSNLTLTSKGDSSEVTDQGFYEVFSQCSQLNSLILKMPINFVDLVRGRTLMTSQLKRVFKGRTGVKERVVGSEKENCCFWIFLQIQILILD